MLVERTIKVWKLSDENKQTIKDNAKEIKNYFATLGFYTCKDYFDDYCSSDSEFLNFMVDFLPFLEEERLYLSESEIADLVVEIDNIIERVEASLTRKDFDDEADLMEFIIRKYDIDDLVEEILKHNDEEFINKLLND